MCRAYAMSCVKVKFVASRCDGENALFASVLAEVMGAVLGWLSAQDANKDRQAMKLE